MPRPTKMTPELVGALAEHLAAGAYLATACEAVGIAPSTFYAWRQRAPENPSTADLLAIIVEAEATAELQAVASIQRAAESDWRAAAWYLEHRYPSRWRGTRTEDNPTTGAPTPTDDEAAQRQHELRQLLQHALEQARAGGNMAEVAPPGGVGV